MTDSSTLAKKPKGESQGVQSAETVLLILSSFIGDEKTPMLKTIAERTNMHPAKVHRYLVSLVRSGYVEQDKLTNRYRLGPAALRLAFAAMNAIDVIRIARPMMAGFCQRVEESLVLGVWNAGGPTIAIKESLPGLLTMAIGEGARLPVIRSSVGAVFAAYMPRDRIQPIIDAELDEIKSRPNLSSPRSEAEVEAMLAEIRERGFARTTGGFNPTAHSFAAPVFDGANDIVAVLSAVGPAGQFNSDWDSPTASSLLACSGEISKALGHTPKSF